MTRSNRVVCIVLAAAFVFGGGCVSPPRDARGYAVEDSVSVEASFDDTWQAVKGVLRDQELDIYTRDKRGTFVAFSRMKRRWFVPRRIQYTITLVKESEDQTRVSVESVRQTYGVKPLTYPDWHDRKTASCPGAREILDALADKTASQ